MFFVDAKALKPLKEFEDVSGVIESMMLEQGAWRVGIRSVDDTWRVIIQIDALDYDVAIAGVYGDKSLALNAVTTLVNSLKRVKTDSNVLN